MVTGHGTVSISDAGEKKAIRPVSCPDKNSRRHVAQFYPHQVDCDPHRLYYLTVWNLEYAVCPAG
jgi:hypothetical protein